MEKKQTAVEWLVKTINYQIDYIPIKHWDSIKDIIKEAKEIEKEQIEQAYKQGMFASEIDMARPKKYYNETYGSK